MAPLDRQMKPWQAWIAWLSLIVFLAIALYFAP